jgi:hypothetical protein
MGGSHARLTGSRVVLSVALLAAWAGGVLAEPPLAGGTWSFSWVVRSESCDYSRRLAAQGRAGCFPDMLPLRDTATGHIRPGEPPTVGLWPCKLDREQRAQLVRWVASRTNPRRFTMKVPDRAKANAVFEASCGLPQQPIARFRLERWSSVATVSPDGRRVRQRAVLWDSFDTGDVRQHFRLTANVRGRRLGDAAGTAAIGPDGGGAPD